MNVSARKGYQGERAVELLLRDQGFDVHRPRAGRPDDVGDLVGNLPCVVSIKNQVKLELGPWVSEMTAMVARTPHSTGVVIHKRRGKGQAIDWYVTTTVGLWLPQLHAMRIPTLRPFPEED
jgi:hypothetical protein